MEEKMGETEGSFQGGNIDVMGLEGGRFSRAQQ
jgi:hypothetical protein